MLCYKNINHKCCGMKSNWDEVGANDVAAGGRWPGEAEDLDEVEWLLVGWKR